MSIKGQNMCGFIAKLLTRGPGFESRHEYLIQTTKAKS